jgi:predicted dehydrogenase
MSQKSRRSFLKTSSAAAVGISATTAIKAASANETIRLGVIGCGGRGSAVAGEFADLKNCEVIFLCDPDSRRAGSLAETISKKSGNRTPQTTDDPRKLLDDKSIDAVLVATPDHWHAPAAILACDAGKHVYVEKPCSHNLREGRLLVEAARRNKRVVQHGTQSRSIKIIQDAMSLLREGVIGDVLVSKAWNVQRRGNIGKGKPADVPGNVNYDMWVGPAAFMPYQANRFHYNWHWWHNFGTGDMGNDGVHELDYARWGLGVETHPSRISAMGTKLFFNDDQQFPDTMQIAFEYPDDNTVGNRRVLLWEMRIWSTNYPYNVDNGVEFYGTKGRLMVTKRGKLEIFGERNKRIEPKSVKSSSFAGSHQQDFLESIRTGRKPNAEIEIGHLSSSLCHLGNIASRLGRTLEFDPNKEQVLNDKEANALLSREYRPNHCAVPRGV